jgi:hypothetical protein
MRASAVSSQVSNMLQVQAIISRIRQASLENAVKAMRVRTSPQTSPPPGTGNRGVVNLRV